MTIGKLYQISEPTLEGRFSPVFCGSGFVHANNIHSLKIIFICILHIHSGLPQLTTCLRTYETSYNLCNSSFRGYDTFL